MCRAAAVLRPEAVVRRSVRTGLSWERISHDQTLPLTAAVPGKRLLTLPDLAERCQLSIRTLQREVAAGRLRCLRLGRQVRFREADVEAWMNGTSL
jgi:excisionase family DNA binding protein